MPSYLLAQTCPYWVEPGGERRTQHGNSVSSSTSVLVVHFYSVKISNSTGAGLVVLTVLKTIVPSEVGKLEQLQPNVCCDVGQQQTQSVQTMTMRRLTHFPTHSGGFTTLN